MFDISPRGNERARDHKTEREEDHVGDGATEPEDLAICDQDDGQILEDRIHGDRQELKGLRSGIDHAN